MPHVLSAGIAQLARVPPCHGGCCGFESHYLLHIPISIKHLLGILILEIITITSQSSFQETNKSPYGDLFYTYVSHYELVLNR